ncbi:hypothetical protein ACP4OV_029228 [Aristida adscensionis]
MAYQVLEVTLISAEDLKRVTLFSKMRVYAVASISGGDPRMPTHRTNADRDGGRSPAWHAPLRFTIPPVADPRCLALHVLLRAERALGDRDVGEVFVPVRDLAAAAAPEGSAGGGGEPRRLSYQLRRPVSGRKRGVLHIACRLTDAPAPFAAHQYVVAHDAGKDERPPDKGAAAAVTAYPAAPFHQAPAYAPPPPPYLGAYPTYGYGAAPYGYAPAPAVAGGGTGAAFSLGFLGGAVGGMMVGDAVEDAAYDVEFMDGGGF